MVPKQFQYKSVPRACTRANVRKRHFITMPCQTRGNHPPPAAPSTGIPMEDRRTASRKLALAILGGRWGGLVEVGLRQSEHAGASRHLVDKYRKQLGADPEIVAAAEAAEAERILEEEALNIRQRAHELDVERKHGRRKASIRMSSRSTPGPYIIYSYTYTTVLNLNY